MIDAKPQPLPTDPRTVSMPEPFTRGWEEWLATTERMNLDQLAHAAGCTIRGCRIEHAWDEEHKCRAFFHNATPITWNSYQALVPAPRTDVEGFFRVVWALHAETDGRADAPSPVPLAPAPPDPAEQKALDRAYAERDMVISLVARLALHAGFKAYIAPDATQDEGWRNVVFVDLPSGQVSWHIHDRELPWFKDVPRVDANRWDGHDTPEKYRRVLAPWPWQTR